MHKLRARVVNLQAI